MSIYSKLKWSQRVSSKIFQTDNWEKKGKDATKSTPYEDGLCGMVY